MAAPRDLRLEPYRQQRLRYEWARVRDAFFGVSPVVGLGWVAWATSSRPSTVPLFACLAWLLGGAMLLYGRAPRRAVWPALVAGTVPLSLALIASRLHLCDETGCTSLCLPACALGGVIAGLTVSLVARRRGAGPSFAWPAAGLSYAIGAMGCACVGGGGLLGLALGFGVGFSAVVGGRRRVPGA